MADEDAAEPTPGDTKPASAAPRRRKSKPPPKPTPDHASEYYSPVAPPAVSKHKTMENELVKVDPALERNAATIPSLLREEQTRAAREAAMDDTVRNLEPVAGSGEHVPPAATPGASRAWMVLTIVLGLIALGGLGYGIAEATRGSDAPTAASRPEVPARPTPTPVPSSPSRATAAKTAPMIPPVAKVVPAPPAPKRAPTAASGPPPPSKRARPKPWVDDKKPKPWIQ